MPPKIRELVAALESAGLSIEAARGTIVTIHPKVFKPITISGNLGDDAKHYQVRAVQRAIEESKR
jgi:hypothetical protein